MNEYTPAASRSAVIVQPVPADLPVTMCTWLEEVGVSLVHVSSEGALIALARRARPRLAVLDGRKDLSAALAACRRLKGDSYTAIIPAVVLAPSEVSAVVAALEAGADEAVREDADRTEVSARLRSMMHRSDRDVGMHPSTRLPGAWAIHAEIEARMAEPCAVCYADLDHFKEFNDRYSYTEGDRVIRILATLLHDVVRGVCHDDGFVGHIGGDDFIFLIPRSRVEEVCAEIIAVFDALIVYQYSEQDRRTGYFFGKDRQGQLHRVPLMTLSIGVVTNERRTFTSAKAVSELATEMKTYAKTLPGSVYAIDRRTDDRGGAPLSTPFMRTGSAR